MKPSPSTVFRSFMVMNTVPSQRQAVQVKPVPKFSMKSTNNNLVCREDWFTLKKFQLKKKPTINDTKLPANVLKAIRKANDASNLQEMDLEKAMMVANAKGAAISVNKHLGNGDGG